MEILNVSGDVLGFVFRRLRNQEGIENGKTTGNMSSELIFKILVNAKYKKDHDIVLTDLERTVMKESGTYIAMYVYQKYEEVKARRTLLEVPYKEISEMTISDIEKDSKKKPAKATLTRKPA